MTGLQAYPSALSEPIGTRITAAERQRLARQLRRLGLTEADYLRALVRADLAESGARKRCRACRLRLGAPRSDGPTTGRAQSHTKGGGCGPTRTERLVLEPSDIALEASHAHA